MPTPDQFLRYKNLSLHGGVNQRLGGRILDDAESTEHLNADISVPGIRRKRKAPQGVSLLATIDNVCPCGGAFVPFDGLLTWSPAAGATGYELQVFAGVSCDGDPILEATVTI